MSSSRFPGKVLAPLHGRPILHHVIAAARAVAAVVDVRHIAVATSTQPSDDPLAAYASVLGVTVVRGPLDHVLERFRQCARLFGTEWIVRLSADSPLVDPFVIEHVMQARLERAYDVVTTVFPRTFPKGQNVEAIRTSALLALRDTELTDDDREHVTAFFYRHPDRFLIRNIESNGPAPGDRSVAVDTLDDLRRLERLAPRATA
jgi:spore coat polysaccharide biosynthesis protein SpsF (cytidylyltransferase family)